MYYVFNSVSTLGWMVTCMRLKEEERKPWDWTQGLWLELSVHWPLNYHLASHTAQVVLNASCSHSHTSLLHSYKEIYRRSGNFRVRNVRALNFHHVAKWQKLNTHIRNFCAFNFRLLSNWQKNFNSENFPIYGRCYEAKKKWKGLKSPGVEPRAPLAWATSALSLSHNSVTTYIAIYS